MKTWVSALLSETLLSAWWILSALSTLSTFFVPTLSGRWRIVSVASAVIGFTVANFRVFQKQEDKLLRLRSSLAAQQQRTSLLRIVPDVGSRYVLQLAGEVRHADFRGCYFEFHLMIENVGLRNSAVNCYELELVELGRTFSNLRPMEGQNGANGRHSHTSFYPPNILTRNGIIRIDSETVAGPGTLLFFVPDIDLNMFVEVGLQMRGPERKFEPLHCRLTMSDTTGSSGQGEFELHEE